MAKNPKDSPKPRVKIGKPQAPRVGKWTNASDVRFRLGKPVALGGWEA